MTDYVDQPSAWPTRKLAWAAMIGPAATEVWTEVMSAANPVLAGPAMAALAGATAALLVGYFVRDKANVVAPAE